MKILVVFHDFINFTRFSPDSAMTQVTTNPIAAVAGMSATFQPTMPTNRAGPQRVIRF